VENFPEVVTPTDTAHSYCEIRIHATLKATQAQGHKKEVEERNIK
jgi:hypothetical protein